MLIASLPGPAFLQSRRITLRYARTRRTWRGFGDNTKGALLLLLAFVFFTAEVVAMRMVANALPMSQMVLVRSASQLVVVLPLILAAGPSFLRTQHLKLHSLRGMLSVLGYFCYFYSFTHLTIVDATTIGFSRNLFITAFAGLFLAEIVRWRRWSATIIGFLGVLVMMQPGSGGTILQLDLSYAIALIGAMTGAAITLATRALATRESPMQIIAYIGIFTTLGSAIPGLYWWVMPNLEQAFWLFVMCAVGVIGQYIAVHAFRLGEASALAPVDYLRLLYAVAAGFLLFNELPGLHTLIGALIIVLSTLYITYREAQLRRQREAKPAA
jgi:drug/metabolite transporter (DMT)-like permease